VFSSFGVIFSSRIYTGFMDTIIIFLE